jgi:pimeloyl-ACP methyl ester carboxylesterase
MEVAVFRRADWLAPVLALLVSLPAESSPHLRARAYSHGGEDDIQVDTYRFHAPRPTKPYPWSDCEPREFRFVIYQSRRLPGGVRAPVVLYLHGAGGYQRHRPDLDVRPLLVHLARQGYLVIHPDYQNGFDMTRPCGWEANAAGAYRLALETLEGQGRVKPDYERTAIVGHSLGGMLAMQFAQSPCLPPPRAIVMHDVAGYSFAPFLTTPLLAVRRGQYSTDKYEQFCCLPPDLLLVALVSKESWAGDNAEDQDGDAVVFGNANVGGMLSRLWWRTCLDPACRFAFLVTSDPCCRPGLESDHGGSTVPVNEIDYTYWRFTDEALRAAFYPEMGPFMPDLSPAWPNGYPRAIPLDGFPPPAPFVWNCDLMEEMSRGFSIILPRGACP